MHAVGAAPGLVESPRLSWVVVVVTVVAITSSSLSALSLYHVLALQAEVEVLRSEVSRRKEGCRDVPEESVRGPQPQQQQQHEDESIKAMVRRDVPRGGTRPGFSLYNSKPRGVLSK